MTCLDRNLYAAKERIKEALHQLGGYTWPEIGEARSHLDKALVSLTRCAEIVRVDRYHEGHALLDSGGRWWYLKEGDTLDRRLIMSNGEPNCPLSIEDALIVLARARGATIVYRTVDGQTHNV